MHIRKVETPGVEIVPISTGGGWRITQGRLFDVDPENADKVEVKGAGFSVWDLCFTEDLLQAVNRDEGLLLDVGWYPPADPSGEYRLVTVRVGGDPNGRPPYDWDNPVAELRTRSLAELLRRIRWIVSH